MKIKNKISQKEVLKGIRKPMPPPSSSFKDKKKYVRKDIKDKFKDLLDGKVQTINGLQ